MLIEEIKLAGGKGLFSVDSRTITLGRLYLSHWQINTGRRSQKGKFPRRSGNTAKPQKWGRQEIHD